MLLIEMFITLLHTEHQPASQTEHSELGNALFHLKRKVSIKHLSAADCFGEKSYTQCLM